MRCPMLPRTYIAIDLKIFYASVECADRQLSAKTSGSQRCTNGVRMKLKPCNAKGGMTRC